MFCKHAFVLFSVENHLFTSGDVIGVVINIFKSKSELSFILFDTINLNVEITPFKARKSS